MTNKLRRIYLEREVSEDIQQLGDNLNEEELKRYEKVEEEFGAKNPAEIDMWDTVWDSYNLPHDAGIPETRLYSATAQATDMRKSQAKKAVKIGKYFDKLIEDEPVGSVESDADGEVTVLRHPLPEERPDLYIDNAEQFANRDVWESAWKNSGYDPSISMSVNTLEDTCEIFDANKENEIQAIITVGEICGAIKKMGDKYLLSLENPDKFWISVWDYLNVDKDEPSLKERITSAIVLSADLSQKEAQLRLEQAISENKLYSPSAAPDNHYRINDISSDKGPEINMNDHGGDGNDNNRGTRDVHSKSTTSTESSSSARTHSTASPETTDQIDECPQHNPNSLTSENNSPKQTATPDLIIAILMLASEGDVNKPYYGLSGRDEFEAWKYARQENIAKLEIPNKALIYFAIEKEEIADLSDIQSEYSYEESRHVQVLNRQKYTQAVNALKAKFDFDILCGTNGMKQQKESDMSTEKSEYAKNKKDSEPASNDPQSLDSESSDTSSREQLSAIAEESSSPAQIDPDEESTGVAINPPGGVPIDEIDAIEIPDEELQSGGQDGANIGGDESRIDRFQTYEEPDEDAENIDIDRYAIKQFVEEFAEVDPDAKDELEVMKDTLLDAFTAWTEINEIELDKLDPDRYINHRKGDLYDLVEDVCSVEETRLYIGGDRPYGYEGISLSDSAYEMIELVE